MRAPKSDLKYIALAAGIDPSQRGWMWQVREYLLNDPEALAAALFDVGFTPYLLVLFFFQRELRQDAPQMYEPGGLAEKAAKKIEEAIEALPSGLQEKAQFLWNFGVAGDDVYIALSWALS